MISHGLTKITENKPRLIVIFECGIGLLLFEQNDGDRGQKNVIPTIEGIWLPKIQNPFPIPPIAEAKEVFGQVVNSVVSGE